MQFCGIFLRQKIVWGYSVAVGEQDSASEAAMLSLIVYLGTACCLRCSSLLTDIDECLDGTHACDINAECLNTIGSYECVCILGFTGNGRQCSRIACPRLDSPENGRVTITGSGFRAQALFECNSGFRINGLDVLVCLVSGMWSSKPPTCDGKSTDTSRALIWYFWTWVCESVFSCKL